MVSSIAMVLAAGSAMLPGRVELSPKTRTCSRVQSHADVAVVGWGRRRTAQVNDLRPTGRSPSIRIACVPSHRVERFGSAGPGHAVSSDSSGVRRRTAISSTGCNCSRRRSSAWSSLASGTREHYRGGSLTLMVLGWLVDRTDVRTLAASSCPQTGLLHSAHDCSDFRRDLNGLAGGTLVGVFAQDLVHRLPGKHRDREAGVGRPVKVHGPVARIWEIPDLSDEAGIGPFPALCFAPACVLIRKMSFASRLTVNVGDPTRRSSCNI